MRGFVLVIAAGCALATARPAAAATFGELVEWCAPEAAGGRSGLCSGYLETYLSALASTDPTMNDGIRACVPEQTDRAMIRDRIEAYAREHPDAAEKPGVTVLGEALRDSYPCK